MEQGPAWISKSFFNNHNVITDKGPSTEAADEILFGTYFFLSNVRYEHTRRIANYMVLSESIPNKLIVIGLTGGVFVLLYSIFSTIAQYINTQLYMNSMMKQMQYVKFSEHYKLDRNLMNKSIETSKDLYQVKYSISDIFSQFKGYICFTKKAKGKFLKHSELLFQRGYDKFEDEMDNINILKTIHKLKAAVSVLVNKKREVDLVKEHYMEL